MDTINGYDEKEIKNTFVLIALYQAILSRTEMNGEASTNTKHGKKIKKFLRILHVDYFQKAFLSDSDEFNSTSVSLVLHTAPTICSSLQIPSPDT